MGMSSEARVSVSWLESGGYSEGSRPPSTRRNGADPTLQCRSLAPTSTMWRRSSAASIALMVGLSPAPALATRGRSISYLASPSEEFPTCPCCFRAHRLNTQRGEPGAVCEEAHDGTGQRQDEPGRSRPQGRSDHQEPLRTGVLRPDREDRRGDGRRH